MASQVLIKMPVSYNNQMNKVNSGGDALLLPSMSSDPHLRITQLEQNLRFLQEQHAVMLNSLHQEMESLRTRNRDLQFQLIFGNPKLTMAQSSSDSSPDDFTKPKVLLTPKEVNVRPLQVEILEKETAELKAALADATTKNTNLSQLVDYQKKQLDTTKKDIASENAARVEDAEKLIKRLVKENEEQRKEISSLRNQLSQKCGGANTGGGGGGGGGRHSGGRRGGGGDHHKFPPLQSHTYWGHGGAPHKGHPRTSPEYRGGGEGRRVEEDGPEVVGQPAPSLPHLHRTYSQPSQNNHRHRYYSNGNHFYRGNGTEEAEGGRRRYRGGRGGGGTANAKNKDGGN